MSCRNKYTIIIIIIAVGAEQLFLDAEQLNLTRLVMYDQQS